MESPHAQRELLTPTWRKKRSKKECRKRGFNVKIETQGALGPESELTQQEVDTADVVILAVGVVIEGTERFEHSLVLNADVNKAISHPETIVDAAVELVDSRA